MKLLSPKLERNTILAIDEDKKTTENNLKKKILRKYDGRNYR